MSFHAPQHQHQHQHQHRAQSFDRAAGVYARSRPGYPPDSVAFLVPADAAVVLDLGAGTGKLTRQLVDRGHAVTAVEPSENMRAQLAAAVPEATALTGTGEAIPVPDASVDAVVVAQAWHWMDPSKAVPEVARVLRPGGTFGLIWNTWVEDEPWLRTLVELIHSNDGANFAQHLSAVKPVVGEPFGEPDHHQFSWEQSLSLDGFVELIGSRSYVITLPDGEQTRLLAAARKLAEANRRPGGLVRIPYLAQAFAYRRADERPEHSPGPAPDH